MSEPDYRAMWEELLRRVARLQLGTNDAALFYPEQEEHYDGRAEAYGIVTEEMLHIRVSAEPDPSHTPAVRRVVAWEAGFEFHGMADDAYIAAALRLIDRASRRAGDRSFRVQRYFSHGKGRWIPTPHHDRVKRLAAWLRHRDESKGYR